MVLYILILAAKPTIAYPKILFKQISAPVNITNDFFKKGFQ